ncbi:hypothetical protein F4823DRAFT_606707 [Ustulina deusta]|nr:hypothetical protein F4823DRAFT_606707 [Ustulina deusta]
MYEGISGYPPSVFEIAWSQSTDESNGRAMELIEESAGKIQTVVWLEFSETYSIRTTIRDHVGTEKLPNRGSAKAFVWRVTFNGKGQQGIQKQN